MRHRSRIAVLISILLVGAVGVGAHDMHQGPGFAPAKVQVRSSDGKVTFPFILVNHHVVFPMIIQGTRLDILLDTGMPMDGLMLYGTSKVAAMKLSYVPGMKARIAGAGAGGRQVEADMALDLTADVGDLHIECGRAIVTPPIPGLAGYHDGVIGATIFKNFVVAIDYDALRITLHDPASWAPPEGSATVPLTLQHDAPFAEVAILTADGRRLPATVVVDLGASHPISLNLGSIDGLAAPAGTIRTIVGLGVSGLVRGQVGRIAGLEIGGLRLKDVVATFPDPDSQHPGGMQERGGNLGDDVLQRFNVAFDYAHQRMVLLPNRGFDRPFEWDMSGLSLKFDDQGAIRIENVVAGSPAGKAGLLAGDILTRVNGRELSERGLVDLRETMRRPGASFAVDVLRDGKPVAVTFTTVRLV
jgi:hypothetical protein